MNQVDIPFFQNVLQCDIGQVGATNLSIYTEQCYYLQLKQTLMIITAILFDIIIEKNNNNKNYLYTLLHPSKSRQEQFPQI